MAFAKIEGLFDEIMEFLTSTPTPQSIINFQPPEQTQARLRLLLDKNRNDQLSDFEREELEEFIGMNRFMSRLKLKAREKLNE